MKKVIMQVSIASPHWSYYPGQEAVLNDDLAQSWEECGHAKIIGDASTDLEQTHQDKNETINDKDGPPKEDGDVDVPEFENASGCGAGKPGRSKKPSQA